MKKKCLALLVSVILVLVMLPGAALAAGGYPEDQWKDFRNSDVNMAITAAQTPKGESYTKLAWAKTFEDYAGVPILVGDAMYAMSDSVLYKLSLADGSVLDRTDMAAAPSKGYCIPPTYVEEKGLIVVTLEGGILQAFDIADLTSRWVYQDAAEGGEGYALNPNGLGGQGQAPVTYADGRLYTGFWQGETKDANFVCVNADTGALEWSYTVNGGFYWAGAVAVGDYILVGTDNGSGDASLLSFSKSYDPAEGTSPVVSSLELTGLGDQRSSMAYADGRVYFTTKTGYLCSAAVNAATGELSGLETYKDDISTSSTSTPVVYGDYVYYGGGKFNNFHFFAADKDTLETVAKVKLKGNPQCAYLLSTAYEESEGCLYFYGTYNAKPGGLTLIKVPAGGAPTDDTLVLEELYDAAGYEEYCIASPICGTDGTIYYKNDSRTIFALGRAEVEVPTLDADLSTDPVKYDHQADTEAAALTVAASVSDGGTLTYQWERSDDGVDFTAIEGAAEASYTPDITALGATWYRCKVTNTKGGASESDYSAAAQVVVKVFSGDTTIKYGINDSNTAPDDHTAVTGATTLVNTAGVEKPRLWIMAPEEGSVTVEQVSGPDSMTEAETTSKGFAKRLAFTSGLTGTNSLKVTATAENGAQATWYIILTPDGAYTPATQSVYVTIANAGEAVMARKEVTAADRNGDGRFDVDEVLHAAHAAAYEGGAEAGYASAQTEYGLSITKLWGDVSGRYGYWLDNASCWSLEDQVAAGSHLVAFVYRDKNGWSDNYAYFERDTYTAEASAALTVDLQAKSGYDAGWNPVFSGFAGAVLTAYDSEFKPVDTFTFTDNGAGAYSATFAESGTYYLVATYPGVVTEGAYTTAPIVPAVCKVTVSAAQGGGGPDTPVDPPKEDTITVSFTLKTHEETWVRKHNITLDVDATVADAFHQVLDGRDDMSYEADSDYVRSITCGGVTWGEFDAGPNSGWKYTINGAAPGVGMGDKTLEDGDSLVWYYVTDYTGDDTPNEKPAGRPSTSIVTPPEEEARPILPFLDRIFGQGEEEFTSLAMKLLRAKITYCLELASK